MNKNIRTKKGLSRSKRTVSHQKSYQCKTLHWQRKEENHSQNGHRKSIWQHLRLDSPRVKDQDLSASTWLRRWCQEAPIEVGGTEPVKGALWANNCRGHLELNPTGEFQGSGYNALQRQPTWEARKWEFFLQAPSALGQGLLLRAALPACSAWGTREHS